MQHDASMVQTGEREVVLVNWNVSIRLLVILPCGDF